MGSSVGFGFFFVFFLSFTVADVLKCPPLLIGLLQWALAPAAVDS